MSRITRSKVEPGSGKSPLASVGNPHGIVVLFKAFRRLGHLLLVLDDRICALLSKNKSSSPRN